MRTLSQSQMNAVKGGQTYIIYDDGIFCTFVDADSEAEALAYAKKTYGDKATVSRYDTPIL